MQNSGTEGKINKIDKDQGKNKGNHIKRIRTKNKKKKKKTMENSETL